MYTQEETHKIQDVIKSLVSVKVSKPRFRQALSFLLGKLFEHHSFLEERTLALETKLNNMNQDKD